MTKTFTEDQVFEEKRKSFADGQLHAKPSPETDTRLNNLEEALTAFMKKFEELPATLALIQRDISDNKHLREEMEKNRSDINALKAWRTGIVMTLGAAMFLFGYLVNIIDTNLTLKMKETAREVLREELLNR